MALRANALAVGNSGIRPEVVQLLLAMLNADILPVIPEKGSLGASGDLAPLAHMALPLIGLGEVLYKNERMEGGRALTLAGLQPVVLQAKEGLALINGTQVMTAIGALALHKAWELYWSLCLASSLSLQALKGIVDAFDPRVQDLRRQRGQIRCAAHMRQLLEGSSLTSRQGEQRVQDAYALRCIPQVHGASLDALAYVTGILEAELNAVTDNPLTLSPPARRKLRRGLKSPTSRKLFPRRIFKTAQFQGRSRRYNLRRQFPRPTHCPGHGFPGHSLRRVGRY